MMDIQLVATDNHTDALMLQTALFDNFPWIATVIEESRGGWVLVGWSNTTHDRNALHRAARWAQGFYSGVLYERRANAERIDHEPPSC